MQAQHTETVFVDEEIITFSPHILYPSVEEFLANLDRVEPHRHWSRQFLIPLKEMGVQTLDDIDMATPESLYVFHQQLSEFSEELRKTEKNWKNLMV